MDEGAETAEGLYACSTKSELREAIRDPSQLPGDELSESVEYDDGSEVAFLHRLWHDLYGDEPVDA